MSWLHPYIVYRAVHLYKHKPHVAQAAAAVAICLHTLLSCSPVRLGRSGVEEMLPLGPMNELEQRNYDTMLPELAGSIQKGVEFVQKRQQQQAGQ
jgi:malate dehydrogenase